MELTGAWHHDTMDECLPAGSDDIATLRMLLAHERAARQELEQEVARLRAGLARQNKRILELERENADLRRVVAQQQQLISGLQEQNALLRQQVAALQAENERLRGEGRPPKHQTEPWPSERTKSETEPKTRATRDGRHNHGRQRMERVDERVTHAVQACPRCGTRLHGGWVHRRVQVIELPAPAHVIVTEHVQGSWPMHGDRRIVMSPNRSMTTSRTALPATRFHRLIVRGPGPPMDWSDSTRRSNGAAGSGYPSIPGRRAGVTKCGSCSGCPLREAGPYLRARTKYSG